MKKFKSILIVSLFISILFGVCAEASVNEEQGNDLPHYKKANFFLQKYNQIQKEDGTTIAYSLNDYYPAKNDHNLIQWDVEDIAALEHTDILKINEKLATNSSFTLEEAKALQNDFSEISNHLVLGYPVLQRTDGSSLTEQDKHLRNIAMKYYNIKEEDLDNGTYQVLWYVIKKETAIHNDGCDYHVDGIIYNVKDGIIPSVTYKYTIKNNFFTVVDNDEENAEFDGSTYEEKIFTEAKSEIYNAEILKTYTNKEYALKGDSQIELTPTEEGFLIEFNYCRYIISPPKEEEIKDNKDENKQIEPKEEDIVYTYQRNAARAPKTGDNDTADAAVALLLIIILFIYLLYIILDIGRKTKK